MNDRYEAPKYKRYERRSTIITSNKPFEEWGEIYNDESRYYRNKT